MWGPKRKECQDPSKHPFLWLPIRAVNSILPCDSVRPVPLLGHPCIRSLNRRSTLVIMLIREILDIGIFPNLRLSQLDHLINQLIDA